jgi:hypothetical protein
MWNVYVFLCGMVWHLIRPLCNNFPVKSTQGPYLYIYVRNGSCPSRTYLRNVSCCNSLHKQYIYSTCSKWPQNELRIMNYELWIMNYELWITYISSCSNFHTYDTVFKCFFGLKKWKSYLVKKLTQSRSQIK